MGRVLDLAMDPHLPPPWEGEGRGGVFGTLLQQPQHCSSPFQGEVRWGSLPADQEAVK